MTKWLSLLPTLLCLGTAYADANADFMAQQAARAPAIAAPYQAEVAELAANAQKNAQAPAIQAYIHSLKNGALTSGPANTAAPTDAPGQLYIFVSASMPKTSLIQWMSQAQKVGAPLVLRGLIHNSVADTQAWVSSLMVDNQGGAQIDPPLFERFQIHSVPAIVVVAPCLAPDCTPDFDVVSGNVSLAQALMTLADKGDANPAFAKQQLAILRGEHA